MLQTVLGYEKKGGKEVMMEVDTEGKGGVSWGEGEKVEGEVKKVEVGGVWGRMEEGG